MQLDRYDLIPFGIGVFFLLTSIHFFIIGNPIWIEGLVGVALTPVLIWLKKGSFWQTVGEEV